MEPLKGQCAIAEDKLKPGVVTVSTKRSGFDSLQKHAQFKESKNIVDTIYVSNKSGKT